MNINSKYFNYEVLSSLSSHIAVVDSTGIIIAVNKTWDEFAEHNSIINITATSEGSNYFNVCEKAIAKGDLMAGKALTGIQSVFNNTNKIFELAYRCDSPTQKRWFLMHVMLLGNEKSKVVISHQDITEKKLAEEAVKASEIRYRRLFEAAKDGILILDGITGKIMDANPFLIDLLGYSLQEFIGKELWELGLFKDVTASKIAFDELQIKKYIRYENLPLEGKEGKINRVEFISNVYKEDQEILIQCNIRDITVQLIAKKKLQESEKKYRILSSEFQEESAKLNEAQSIARIGSWEFLTKKQTFIWSRETYRIFESTPKTFNPTIKAFLQSIHEDDREKVNRALKESYTKLTTNSIEHRIYTQAGKLRYVVENWNVFKNNEGLPFRVVGTCQDITDRKIIEFEKENMVEQLQLQNKDLNQFAYIVSHNLRSHITKIQGLLFLIEIDEEHFDENPQLLKTISDEVIRLDDVIKDLNKILSLRDAYAMQTEPILFEENLNKIKEALSIEISEINASITADFTGCPGVITINSYCYSIMYNLLSNAIKYRSPDRPLQVHFTTKRCDPYICLAVKDNGMGIDLIKNGDKIFALYKRFHGSAIPGKGIGLNLVKVQIESLGGRVEVESTFKSGTTFKIYFPVLK